MTYYRNISNVPTELRLLVGAACNGTIDADGMFQLESHLRDDDRAMDYYLDCIELHGDIYRVLKWRRIGEGKGVGYILPERPEGCFAQNVPDPFSLVEYFSQPGPLSMLVAAIFMVCMISILNILPAPTYQPTRSNHACNTSPNSPGRQPGDGNGKLNLVARITGKHNCRWSAEGRAPYSYDHMGLGRKLKLDSGIVEITYYNGAKVVLEGPVEFTVEEKNACRLDLGKLTAKVSEPAVGFTVDTPSAKIVDLGTEFGVSADRQGKTEVAVFLGAVEVGSESGGGGFRLTAGQAARVDAKGALTMLEPGEPDSRPRFVRHMPGAPPVQTGIDAEHIGANDPETQDPVAWGTYGIATAKGAGTDELAHWYIRTNAGKCYDYEFALTDYKLTDPDGWTATAVAKLVTADTAVNAYFGVIDDRSDWWMFTLIGGPGVSDTGVYTLGPILANRANRDLVLLSSVDPTLAYHTYQIVYDPMANNGDGGVTFYMDGQALLTYGRTDAPDLSTRLIAFGDGTRIHGASESHWASCRFQTGQHPITDEKGTEKGEQLEDGSPRETHVEREIDKKVGRTPRPASTQLQKGASGAVGVP